MKRSAMTIAAGAAFASLVVLILANPPEASVLLFAGGLRDGLFGLAMFSLVPLIVIVEIGIGAALARWLGDRSVFSEIWLQWLSGSAILSLVGVALAIAGLINPWISGSVLVLGVAYAVASGSCRDVVTRLTGWVGLDDVSAHQPVVAVARLGIVVALLLIGLRAATGELNDTDVVQFYWGWLNEVRYLGGTALSPDLPLVQDFTAGRGNGVYLLFAGMAPGLVSHVVSATYCVMLAMLLRAFVRRIAADGPASAGPILLVAAEVACLASLWILPGTVAFGKYHLQFAAWGIGILVACLHIAATTDQSARAWRSMLLPLAFAITIGLAQFEAFIAMIVAVTVIVTPHRWLGTRRLLPLLVVGCVGAGLSLFGNWLYLGIPDLNPFALFERFIRPERFALWTSSLQQNYINYIGGGVLSLQGGDGVSRLRALRSLASDLRNNWMPIAFGLATLAGVAGIASFPVRARSWRYALSLMLAAGLAYVLYRLSHGLVFTDLALSPILNRGVLYAGAAILYLFAVRSLGTSATRPYLLSLLGYWLICAGFVLLLRSGSMDRLMRHADVVGVTLLLIGIVGLIHRLAAFAVRAEAGSARRRLRASAALPILLAVGFASSWRAAVSAAAVDPPSHLFASTLGLEGRAKGLTLPTARFDRCSEIAASVPADRRVLFLNAYTAMAYCNNAVLLPRGMIVTPHESDFAREISQSAFADADTVERTLRRLRIDHFLMLKNDFEFWASGLSAPFRPGELERRFDLSTETPTFYVLTWKGGGRAIPPEALAAVTELRRFAIQQSGFMAQNEFVSQWRAMANLGADRPRLAFRTPVDFTSKGWSALYADHGWYAAEPHGTWTIGPLAVLTLPLPQPSSETLRITMDVMPFLIPEIPQRIVRVKQGVLDIAQWTFRLGDGNQVKEFDVNPAGADRVVLTFEIDNSTSQYALRLNTDWRPLGVAVRSLTIAPVASN